MLPAGAFPCCRGHDLFAPIEKYPVALQRTPGDEAYWIDCSNAAIRVAKLADEVMVFREYRVDRFGKVRRFRGC